jgi:hypothetical protein
MDNRPQLRRQLRLVFASTAAVAVVCLTHGSWTGSDHVALASGTLATANSLLAQQAPLPATFGAAPQDTGIAVEPVDDDDDDSAADDQSEEEEQEEQEAQDQQQADEQQSEVDQEELDDSVQAAEEQNEEAQAQATQDEEQAQESDPQVIQDAQQG